MKAFIVVYALVCALALVGCGIAEQEAAEQEAERQRWLALFSAKCRLLGIQEGTPAWSDCITVHAAEELEKIEDRQAQERAARLSRQQQTDCWRDWTGAIHCRSY